jgi:Flp pilus assembly protein TadD
MSKLHLPDAPPSLSGPVKSWCQPVSIPTYRPMPADKNPMFLEKRVYQGSSGKVYPLPFTDRIAEEKTDQSWDAVHIENEFIRLMILPQIGGRIHVGLDKTNGYDFFYRQNVIKPALVGLAGPWISGGVEFNWPQHHRPSTFMPVNVHIENHPDGSVTIWCSEHEPMNRMKGMHGICLHPGKSVVELKVRLFNRTEFVQTFLWWANVAARVHEQYRSFFPPDVSYVADHAKRAMSRFPHCEGLYYGVDYPRRRKHGVAPDEKPAQFVPPSDKYLPDDLSWYANIPVPTSYMAMGSSQDFFGGYDHGREAGLVHWANHRISPGKKQWTWGNHEFGYAWDRNLTDDDGPYIELMAGVYTDNQPDFSFLHPGETRTFSQFWYPIQKIGPAQKANLRAAVSLNVHESRAHVGVATTEDVRQAVITLSAGGNLIDRRTADITPKNPLLYEVAITYVSDLKLNVTDSNGKTIIEYSRISQEEKPVPAPATEPAQPADVATNDELYLIGVHLQQYRHATRDPAAYWREALHRDPADSRCNTALGIWHLRRGEFQFAVDYLSRAVESLTRRNPNPPDGEAHYHLGIALRYLGRDEAAYDALYKSSWNFPWQSPAFYALAEIDCRRQDWPQALEHLDRSLRVNAENLNALDLKSVVLRFLGRDAEAKSLLHQTFKLDPLDFWAIHSLGKPMDCDAQTKLDLALDFARAGFYQGAVDLLATLSPSSAAAEEGGGEGLEPLIDYYRAYFLDRLDKKPAAAVARTAAKNASPDYCFPSRLDDIFILQAAIHRMPELPITLAISITTAAGTSTRSPSGKNPRSSIQRFPSSGETWASLISISSTTPRPQRMRTNEPLLPILMMRDCFTNSINCASELANRQNIGSRN